MKNIIVLFSALILLAACVSENILPPPDKSYVPDIHLKELAQKMVNAVDPNGIYRKSNSYFMKQELGIDGKTFIFEVTFKNPDKSRTVTYLNGKIIQTTVCDGKKCWVMDRSNKKTEITGKDLERLKLLDEMSSPKGTILDSFDKVEFAGEAKVYDSACYILFCYPKVKELEPIVLYVSKTDYLTRKIITLKNGKPYVAIIRKYALLKGVMIATETEMDINDDGKMELMTVTDYKINIDAPDSEFQQ
jgi:outer membrane lipoprotein-sorting protein